MTEPKVVDAADAEWAPTREIEVEGVVRGECPNCARLADRVEELEGWQEEAFRDVIHAKTEVARLREALYYAEKMAMKDGNISGEYLQVVEEALKEKP